MTTLYAIPARSGAFATSFELDNLYRKYGLRVLRTFDRSEYSYGTFIGRVSGTNWRRRSDAEKWKPPPIP